jgi:hypothetical protein
MDALLLFFVLGILVLVPLFRMLFGRGPNNLRKLVRPDLAAFLVLTAGVALAFAIVRNFNWLEATCILVIALPAMIALAWLGRYMLEEFILGWRRRDQHERTANLDFLKVPEPIEAVIVEEPDPGNSPR